MGFDDYLTFLAKHEGSDLYLSTGAPPCAKFNGKLKPIEAKPLSPGVVREFANEVMSDRQKEEFEQELEMNLAYGISGVGRFRINIFRQRNEISIVARNGRRHRQWPYARLSLGSRPAAVPFAQNLKITGCASTAV
ncbi:MAG: hypothetical protein WED11_04720 [Natronospirillum sp.]